MSLRAKKASAFSVFKSRKAHSSSDVPAASETPKGLSRSASASTPRCNSEKKKKVDMKKLKKILKSGSKQRPSFLPDKVLHSPFVGGMNGESVELRSLRPKSSQGSINYNLPLRTTPDLDTDRKMKRNSSGFLTMLDTESTPPIPPRVISGKMDVPTGKRSSPVPDLPPRGGNKTRSGTGGAPNNDHKPTPPIKRRRVSAGSSHSTANQEEDQVQMESPLDAISPQTYMFNSLEDAQRLFECLIHPVVPSKFFADLWEKKPLLVKRHQPDYNDGWFSTAELDRILRQENIKFGENLDVVTYENQKRETHNPAGRAHAPVVWDYYQNGCSVRMLNPQTYSRNVWKLLSILQEYFSCFVGANVYLTPPDTQGFAPHWDDIEAFIIQLEGKKHWRLYSPRSEAETLPRYSSNNFTDADIGEPILDVILEAGDLLYFPRGTIHQGRTLEGEHSLHITVSCNQKNSWGDLMERIVPQALKIAINEDLEFRKALPKDFLQYMGVAFSDNESEGRKNFISTIKQLMGKVLTYLPVDAACDQMGKQFVGDSLPPVLTENEKSCSIHGNGERWDGQRYCVVGGTEIEPDTNIKLIRRGAVRLVMEEDSVSVYHNLENSRIYRSTEPQFIDLDCDFAPAVEYLLNSYPEFVTVDSLPLEKIQDKVELAALLYDKGLILTGEPLLEDSDGADDSV